MYTASNKMGCISIIRTKGFESQTFYCKLREEEGEIKLVAQNHIKRIRQKLNQGVPREKKPF